MGCLARLVLCIYSNITFAHIHKLISSPGSDRGCATVRADLLRGLNAGENASTFKPSKQQ